jgi:hypothetical protein
VLRELSGVTLNMCDVATDAYDWGSYCPRDPDGVHKCILPASHHPAGQPPEVGGRRGRHPLRLLLRPPARGQPPCQPEGRLMRKRDSDHSLRVAKARLAFSVASLACWTVSLLFIGKFDGWVSFALTALACFLLGCGLALRRNRGRS